MNRKDYHQAIKEEFDRDQIEDFIKQLVSSIGIDLNIDLDVSENEFRTIVGDFFEFFIDDDEADEE